MMRHTLKTGPVEPRWPNATVVCIASGPSLTQGDVDFVRGKARVIVVNNTYQLAPWADALWATDSKWWRHHADAANFSGLKFAIKVPGLQYPADVHVLKNTGIEGLELQAHGVRNGKNGGQCAINVAVHLGASRIVLLGYDCQLGPKGEEHWHGRHPQGLRTGMPIKTWRQSYQSLVQPLRDLKIDVVNCTRRTALTCFRRASLDEVLSCERESLAS